jgi:hypothetical protein
MFHGGRLQPKYDGHHDNDDYIDVPSSPGSLSKVECAFTVCMCTGVQLSSSLLMFEVLLNVLLRNKKYCSNFMVYLYPT